VDKAGEFFVCQGGGPWDWGRCGACRLGAEGEERRGGSFVVRGKEAFGDGEEVRARGRCHVGCRVGTWIMFAPMRWSDWGRRER